MIENPADYPLRETVRQMQSQMRRRPLRRVIGRLNEVGPGGLSTTLGDVAIGEICRLRDPHSGQETISQVVAIRNGRAILAPIGTTDGLSARTDVIPEYGPFTFWCGMEMLGGVYDGLGNRIDGKLVTRKGMIQRDIVPRAPSPLDRPLIDSIMPTGISAVDGVLTCGIGQRVALLGPPGAGKSTFIGALARNASADICVLALIGERGRELREFLDRQLPPEFRERCIVVASTSDRPAMERVIGAHIATSIAEYFRERGHHVLLLFDSVTRFARALREVGLASGEQPVRRGFTPSVYAELPRLIERCGKDPNGAITALYTVLLENDGMNDPIAEEIVSLTDGHLVLAGKLAQAGHYPALDVLRSTSRVMNEIVDDRHLAASRKLRALMARYEEVELLVQVGEYEEGRDALADEAIAKRDRIHAFLRQPNMRNRPFAETVADLERLVG
jgi:type III secretion protein N (ATPase)